MMGVVNSTVLDLDLFDLKELRKIMDEAITEHTKGETHE